LVIIKLDINLMIHL